MTLNKPVKILVGLATLWYAIYLFFTVIGVVLLFGYIFFALMTGAKAVTDLQELLMQTMSLGFMLPIHFCSLFLEVGLLIFYLVHTIKNTKASDALRIMLGLGHLFLPFVAMPVYYYLFLWRENPPEWASPSLRKVDPLRGSIA
jgi:hypothetical protein